jgi:hypothetical protein
MSPPITVVLCTRQYNTATITNDLLLVRNKKSFEILFGIKEKKNCVQNKWSKLNRSTFPCIVNDKRLFKPYGLSVPNTCTAVRWDP